MYLIFHSCFYICFIDVREHPEEDQDKSKHVWATTNCGTVGCGIALQFGRSRVRFPRGSLGFFVGIILSVHYGPGVDSASNKYEYQEYIQG